MKTQFIVEREDEKLKKIKDQKNKFRLEEGKVKQNFERVGVLEKGFSN